MPGDEKKLTPELFAKLKGDDRLGDETKRSFAGTPGEKGSLLRAVRSGLQVKPPSALPPKTLKMARGAKAKTKSPAVAAAKAASKPNVVTQGFAIQIKPHHNGEIFLSVTAALQNPQFFKWPFTGMTTPKKAGAPAYPQLSPDPKVNIAVYGAGPIPFTRLVSTR